MPRFPPRRKTPAVNNNNNDDPDLPPQSKMRRTAFELPLPERPRVIGRAFVCGQGDMGQLGLGDDESNFERKRPALLTSVENVVDVRAGGMHNLVLTEDGRVYSFGCNDEGALGRESTKDGSEFEPAPIDLPGKVLKISAGDSHSACLLEDGRVFAWGSFRDSHGNMGLTLEGNKLQPINVLPGWKCCDIASGADHLVILTCSGKVYTVGCAEQGQLGRVSLRTASGESRRGKVELLRPGEVIIKRKKPIEAIWATNYCTFLREANTGIIWAFGLNNYKQLGYPKEMSTVINPIKMGVDNVKEIAGGQHHTIVLKENGSCFAMGRSDYGRLGLGDLQNDINELMPIEALANHEIVTVSCGEAQSFAVTADGKLFSWGMGSNYQLGIGTDDDKSSPVLVTSKQIEGKPIIRVSSGGQHSIFLAMNEKYSAPLSSSTPKAVSKEEKAKLQEKLNAANEENNTGDATPEENEDIGEPASKRGRKK